MLFRPISTPLLCEMATRTAYIYCDLKPVRAFHLKALVSFVHLVIFVVCRHVFFFVFVPIFFIAWFCYESR